MLSCVQLEKVFGVCILWITIAVARWNICNDDCGARALGQSDDHNNNDKCVFEWTET